MAKTIKFLGRTLNKRLLWLLLIVPFILLLAMSTLFAKFLLFAAMLAYSAIFVFFSYRLGLPFDVSPVTIFILVIGYYYGPLWVILYFLLGSLIPGILAGGGIGPSSFVYIPLNLVLGFIFPGIAGALIPSLIVVLLLYALIVFVVDGFFFSSYARSLLMSLGFLAGAFFYLAVIWRLQTILHF